MGGVQEWYQGNDNAYLHDGTFNPDGFKSSVCIEYIWYSGFVISRPSKPYNDSERRIIKTFFNAVQNRRVDLVINNALFELTDATDPARGQRKECTLQYRMHPSGPLLGQQCFGYERMNFFHHCLAISYGVGPNNNNVIMNDPSVYYRFNRALRNSLERCDRTARNFYSNSVSGTAADAVHVTNDNCGGDPAPGKTKTVKVVYERVGERMRACTAGEGQRWPDLLKFQNSLGINAYEHWIQGPGFPW